MIVRVSFTVDIDDDIRREISEHYGESHLATRAEIRQWYENFGRSEDENLSRSARWRERQE